MSEDEIKLDIQRQAVEKAGSEEVKVLGETIKQTGIFREIYRAYKINPDNMGSVEGGAGAEGGAGGASMGGMTWWC